MPCAMLVVAAVMTWSGCCLRKMHRLRCAGWRHEPLTPCLEHSSLLASQSVAPTLTIP